jgi:hypothetical protein
MIALIAEIWPPRRLRIFSILYFCSLMLISPFVSAQDLPAMRVDQTDFVNVTLKIMETKIHENEVQITARGTWQEKAVGIRVGFPFRAHGLRIDGKEIRIDFKSLTIYSLGVESDNLGMALAQLYHMPAAFKTMAQTTTVQSAILARKPETGLPRKIMTKAFFEKTEPYGELYINYDADAQSLELKEKDEEYRLGVLRGLSADR